ncbi:hypothetical protein [Rhodoferax sp. PAMC 29310]|uniref:hypothetical protein n=1 Tax=Rhodoferax sp. PAMC 29310 TaxID=2822760 RepID=UPI001B32EC0E|nr:hypothetical protein [Rhodoferax sp. PAMC 29310]
MKRFFALFFIALYALSTGVFGQNDIKSGAATCPTPTDVAAVHLYGLWHAELEGQAQVATLQFERHPDNAGSVRGRVTRGNTTVVAAGDVDEGEFSLEESIDGQRISATWLGTVVPDSCGKEIRGSWNNALDNTNTAFVLRKAPGWQ